MRASVSRPVLLLLAVLALGAAPAPSATAATPAAVAVPAEADARVQEAAPGTNYRRSYLRADGGSDPDVESYLRFSVSGLPGTVQSARLRIYAYRGTKDGPAVYGTGSTWSEDTISWASRPARTSGATDDKGAIPGGSWVEYDVTPLVGGDGTFSFVLATTSSDGIDFYSRERTLKPRLVVTTTATPPLTLAAYYYPWYGTGGRHWQEGYLRGRLSTPHPPLLGEYDSRSASTIDSHLRWAQQYGIDAFICSWWGPNGYEDVTIKDHLIRSPSIGNTKITILYESISRLGLTNGLINFDAATEQKLIADFDYLARTYFGDSHYQKIDGKPVVYLYVTRIYRGNYQQAISNLRTEIRNRYGYDLYLVGDEVDWDGAPDRNRIRVFDAITPYTMYSDLQPPGWPDDTGFLNGVRQRYTSFKSAADAEGVRFIPGVLPAFNDRGVRLQANHYALPHELNATYSDTYSLLSEFLRVASASVDPSMSTMTVTSWNEWHEDTQVEPTTSATPSASPSQYTQGYTYHSYGFKLLEIFRSFKSSWGG